MYANLRKRNEHYPPESLAKIKELILAQVDEFLNADQIDCQIDNQTVEVDAEISSRFALTGVRSITLTWYNFNPVFAEKIDQTKTDPDYIEKLREKNGKGRRDIESGFTEETARGAGGFTEGWPEITGRIPSETLTLDSEGIDPIGSQGKGS